MKPKGTKGRKPKPYSKGGRRAARAEAARQAAPADRREQSRAEAKREAAKRLAEKPTASQKGAGRGLSSVRRGDAYEDTSRPLPQQATGIPAEFPEKGRGTPAQAVESGLEPVLAIVGRPNVGKSTLFNRLTGSRRSIVGDEPGITRDRIYGQTEWMGRNARVVDTGGILPNDPELIPAEIFRQAQVALHEAALIVMVVDGRAPLTATDYDLARLLFASGKPLLLAVNKLETGAGDGDLGEYRRLGIRDVVAISAEHGIGIDELLDHAFAAIPENHEQTASATESHKYPIPESERDLPEQTRDETSIAIIGRPNVGKSTLLNALTRSSRAIVSPLPGTTRDAVDEVVEYRGQRLRFVDTAGIRRKGKTSLMAEKLSVVMARRHLEAADLALLVIDATEGVTASDATIGGYAHESGRSVILVVNKWDLVTTGRADGKPPADKAIFETQLRRVLKYLAYAPVVFISASEGKNLPSLLNLVREVAAERRKRISTGQMNRFLEQVDFERASVPAAHSARILYMTQAAVAPPTFILFTNRQVKLHFSFRRFLENQIRAAFGFRGSPIWFKVRARESSKAKPARRS